MTGAAAALALGPLVRLRQGGNPPGEDVAGILRRALELGLAEQGKPYSGPIVGQPDSWRYGNPGYDCSSFCSEMLERATGLNLYSWAYTDTIARESRRLDPSEVLPGDIVEWRYQDSSQPNATYPHVGLVYDLEQRLTLDCRYSSGENVGIRPFLNAESHYFRPPQLEKLAGATLLTPAQIARCTACKATAVIENWPGIERALRELGILSKPVAVAAAATIAIETAHTFRPIEEFYDADNWARYGGGPDYHGRGYVQLTHDFNYRDAGATLGLDLVGNHELALDPETSARILAWFFLVKGVAAAANRGDWETTRRNVLGGLGDSYPTYKGYIDGLLAS